MKNTNPTKLNLPLADAIVMTSSSATFTLHPCGPLDGPALIDFTNSNLKNDYYFAAGHWRSVLAESKYQVFAVSELRSESPTLLQVCGIVITYQHSRLLNLFLSRELRGGGLGKMILEALAPDEIRAKTDWSDGDPTDFYTSNGYAIIQSKTGKNCNITVLRRASEDAQPSIMGAAIRAKNKAERECMNRLDALANGEPIHS